MADDQVAALPATYGVDLILLQPRDPRWLHAYWELAAGTVAKGRARLGAEGSAAELILRVHEEGSSRSFDLRGLTAQDRSFDVRLVPGSQDWYLEVEPDRGWFVEIGLKSSQGSFLPLARSNVVRTPPDRPSDRIDETWGVLEGVEPAAGPAPTSHFAI